MIKKLHSLSPEEERTFYASLTRKIAEVIGSDFQTEEAAQQSFNEFKLQDISDYRNVLNTILSEISPIPLTWRDLKKLNYKRVKLCTQCHRLYIDYSAKNRAKACYLDRYQSWTVSSRRFKTEIDSRGRIKSPCIMSLRNETVKKHYQQSS